MHPQAQWILNMVISLFVLGVATRAFALWVRQERGAAVSMLIGAAVVSVVVSHPGQVTNLADKALGALAGEEDPTPKPSDRPHTGPTGPDIPWTTLLAGLGGVVSLALLAGVAVAVRAQHGRRLAERRRRAELETRHDAVRDAYASFITDILAVLDRPALSDVTVPETERLVLALDAARDGRKAADTGAYRTHVIALEIAWKAADQHARKASTRILAAHEQRAVHQARHLLVTALDDTGNAHERHAAYQKAVKLISNIIEVPREAVAAIAAATRHTLPKK